MADLNGDGRPDIVVLAVDGRDETNAGRYRVGRSLDASGAVSGGWGGWLQIPGWRFRSNADAAIALADLDGDGRPDLVVFAIETGARANRAHYRVGRSLDADGAVTGGWTPWTQIPDWSAKENSGGEIALADLNGDGVPELIVVMADPDGGHYRVGWSLDATGKVSGEWEPWTAIPDWQEGASKGLGADVADLDGDGRPELLVLDRGRYTIGWGLDETGRASDGLEPVVGAAREPSEARHVGLAGLPDRRRAARADGARQRRRRRAPGGSRRRRVQGGRLADPRPQLADPRRARGAAAHRRRAVVRRLGRRPRRPRRRPLPHAGLALPEPPLHLSAHADRPLLRRPDLPRGRARAGRRRHEAVRAVPRHRRRPRVRPRGPALDPRAADAAPALVPDAHHARRRPRAVGLRPRRHPRARARPGDLRGRRGVAAAALTGADPVVPAPVPARERADLLLGRADERQPRHPPADLEHRHRRRQAVRARAAAAEVPQPVGERAARRRARPARDDHGRRRRGDPRARRRRGSPVRGRRGPAAHRDQELRDRRPLGRQPALPRHRPAERAAHAPQRHAAARPQGARQRRRPRRGAPRRRVAARRALRPAARDGGRSAPGHACRGCTTRRRCWCPTGAS